jgi:hypothetical protein
MHVRDVRVEEPCSRAQLRPLLLQNLQKGDQGLGEVNYVDSLPLGTWLVYNTPFFKKKAIFIFKLQVAWTLALTGAWCPLLKLLV